jgi:hypothetical protein
MGVEDYPHPAKKQAVIFIELLLHAAWAEVNLAVAELGE